MLIATMLFIGALPFLIASGSQLFTMQAMRSSSLHGAPLQRRAPKLTRSARLLSASVKAAKVENGPKVAIVGVTGAVGQEFLRVRDPSAAYSTAVGKPQNRCIPFREVGFFDSDSYKSIVYTLSFPLYD